ncbi:hypothetical protein [Nitrosococcus watsonii]|nr:hypothetical protein [Nitrosococcus watsonii]
MTAITIMVRSKKAPLRKNLAPGIMKAAVGKPDKNCMGTDACHFS